METVNSKIKLKQLSKIPLWVFAGAALVMTPLFTIFTIENIHTQKLNSYRLLLEKGAALIRSFEAGTRTGMAGMQWKAPQLQRLMHETAKQPDIDYLFVITKNGLIIAHNNPAYIGKWIAPEQMPFNMDKSPKIVNWRIKSSEGKKKIFEVYRRFLPAGNHRQAFHMQMMKHRQTHPEKYMPENMPLYIFAGLDMSSVEIARKSEMRHVFFIGGILLLIGFSGIVLLFLFQNYRMTRASLTRIKAFSDQLVESMPIGLIALDHQNRISSLNPAAIAILPELSSFVIGRNAGEVLPEELLEELSRPAGPNRGIEREIECRTCDNRALTLEIITTELEGETDTSGGMLLLFKDLSEISKLRKEIDRNRRLVSVGKLAAGVAHEIRNPLSSLKGFATYFSERYHDKPEDLKIAEIMIQEVERLNKVVGQLLDFSRPVSIGKKEIELKPFMENSLKLIENDARKSGIDTEIIFEDEVQTAVMDPDKINQALLNLYLNAIDAMSENGSLTARVQRDRKNAVLKISVQDTGGGISKEDLAHIFDPYFTTKSTGTGLGLAIVHNIMDAHEGKVTVSSLNEKGTTVTLILPEQPDKKTTEN